jgi:hypothetical protein
MAEEVFNDITSSVNELKDLDYDSIGESGIQIKFEKNKTVKTG